MWEAFADDPPRLRELADLIRATCEAKLAHELAEVSDDADEEAEEGKLLMRLHKTRERNRKLVRKKKQLALEKYGRLACEVCGFDFALVYGGHGEAFIECHHCTPLGKLKVKGVTRLQDLALVCANCHRMLHRGKRLLAVKDLQTIVETRRRS
ncbi:MAG: HNH endonuclease [Planctomycetota bacterium]